MNNFADYQAEFSRLKHFKTIYIIFLFHGKVWSVSDIPFGNAVGYTLNAEGD